MGVKQNEKVAYLKYRQRLLGMGKGGLETDTSAFQILQNSFSIIFTRGVEREGGYEGQKVVKGAPMGPVIM